MMFSFPKAQRLNKQTKVRHLFTEGEGFLSYPFSVKYSAEKGEGSVQVLISCPKRVQKLAVHRNRVKRLIRESYRLNSIQIRNFAKQYSIDIAFAVVYVSKDILPFNSMQNKTIEMLSSLQENIISKCLNES